MAELVFAVLGLLSLYGFGSVTFKYVRRKQDDKPKGDEVLNEEMMYMFDCIGYRFEEESNGFLYLYKDYESGTREHLKICLECGDTRCWLEYAGKEELPMCVSADVMLIVLRFVVSIS